MSKPLEPRPLLDALFTAGEVSGFEPAVVERARSLARDPERAPPDAIEALPEPLALAVLEGAVQARSAALADALSRSGQRAIAKAAKKALYRLRSGGVPVPEPRPAAAEAAPSPRMGQEKEELPVLLSAMTGAGERGMLLARPIRGGGLESFQFVLSDELGILQLGRAELSRGLFRRQLKELRAGHPPVLEIARAEANELLGDAAAKGLEANTTFPEGAEDALRHLDVSPKRLEATLPAPTPEDERLATEAHKLHEEPELAPWLPPDAQLRELVARIDEVLTSPLQLSEAQRLDQLRQKVRLTLEAFLTPSLRALYARRLWYMGRFFEATGRPHAGAIARAEALRIEHRIGESRFLEALFEKVLVLSERARAGAPMPRPGERMGAAEPSSTSALPPAERKSPGGLILP